tara:strand:- start:178 stop:327 length:150 start_codon:yes stop_codon:yes gene_type:complete
MEEKIKELRNQQEAAKELFIKCQGAIEVLEGMMKEEEEKEKKKDVKEAK